MTPTRFLLSTALTLALSGAALSSFAQDKTAPAAQPAASEMSAVQSDKTKPDGNSEASDAAPRIQIALLLDTSNSMDGLISQAKSQLWNLVNELGAGEKNGKKPVVELALYEYGNSGLSITNGYIRQIVSLTTDLDLVSEELFALDTNGGEEYAGQVIKTALDDLEWSVSEHDMKLILIAGNERFTQGPISYESACQRAKSKGVVIDTIHCGDYERGVSGKWKDGAECSGGIYMTINQDEKSVYIPSPYDDEILKLNKALNDTYIGYGRLGEINKARQEAQDANAGSMSTGSFISRTRSKASAQYRNENWDIVDAYDADKARVLALSDDQLPEEMKGMDADARTAFIEKKAAERRGIQEKIKALQVQQKEFVSKEKANMAKTMTLDEIVVTGARRQAEESGFKFKK